MRKHSPRPHAKPLTECALECGHVIGLRHKPQVFDPVFCPNCCTYTRVIIVARYFGDCKQCDWFQDFTTESRAGKAAAAHTKLTGHATKILGTDLNMKEFAPVTESGQYMIGSVEINP